MRITVIVALLALSACETATQSNTNDSIADKNTNDTQSAVYPWGRETVENTEKFFAQYAHILQIRISEDFWISNNAPKLSTHHIRGVVTKVYKGTWNASENISLYTTLDGPSPDQPVSQIGSFVIVLTNKKTHNEISLDTGEAIPFEERLESGLTYFYPPK